MRRILTSLFFMAAGVVAAPVFAGPWAEAGDRQLRQDVELLKAAGVITGPVNSWPLPWAQIAHSLDQTSPAALPPHVERALRRLRQQARYADQTTRFRAVVKLASDEALVRDFSDQARSEADVSMRAEHDLGRLYVSYGVGFRDGQQGHDAHFEPPQVAVRLGNWALYGGYVDTWWGPGNENALLFSSNARPIPRIGIKRLSPEPFNLPVLKWLGPWRFDMFAGIATEKRADYDNPAIIGIRVAFEPVHGLEIGLNRGLQLCGEARPCSASVIGKALFGLGNVDNTGSANEPGNQIAGLDVSYSRMIGPVNTQIYMEAEAEDEVRALIDKFSRMGGIKLTGPLGQEGATWSVGFEAADTLAIRAFGSRRFANLMYNNHIYKDGWTYRDQVLGASIGGDAKMFTLSAALTDQSNRRYYGSVRKVDLNRTGIARHSPSRNAEDIHIGTAGVELPTAFGDLRLEGRVMDDKPDTPGRSPVRGEIELGWTARF